MAVLPASAEFLATPSTSGASRKIPASSHDTVAAIAANQNPAAKSHTAMRRTSSSTSAAVSRKGNPDKRANHNAVERARRDSLNQRLLVLASKLPCTSEVRRPSKSLIVDRSLHFISQSLSREQMYRKMITDLNDRTRTLTEQLNDYRMAYGLRDYVEPIHQVELPAPMTDMPKFRPDGRGDIASRKSSIVAEGELTADEGDDGALHDPYITETPPAQQSVPMTAQASGMPHATSMHAAPSYIPPEVPLFAPTLTASPLMGPSSPGAYPELSPPSSASGVPSRTSSIMTQPMMTPSQANVPVGMLPMMLPCDGSRFDFNQLDADFTHLSGPTAFANS